VEKMIEKAISRPESEGKNKMVLSIANIMKMAYLAWNKDAVSDDLILDDLKELSKGQLSLPEGTVLTKLDFRTPPPGSRGKGTSSNNNSQKGKKQGGKKNHGKKNNHKR